MISKALSSETVSCASIATGMALPLVTVILNGVRVLVSVPSETETMMSPLVPTSSSTGIPDNSPEELFKLNHAGKPVTEKVNVSLSASLAVGVKL